MASAAKAMRRYTQLPLTLFRIQPRLPVSLRDYAEQMANGRTSYDLKTYDTIVRPMPADSPFHTPNGMSLRASSEKMATILREFRGEPRVYRMQEGTLLPSGLVVLHEHTDHYSLQVSEEMALAQFNQKLTDYLKTLPNVSKAEWLAAFDDVDDQDN
jgi:hypothetical protein